MNAASVRKRCTMFRNGRTDVYDAERSGRPSVITDALKQKVNRIIRENREAQLGSLEALETLWSWAKDLELNTHEFLPSRSGDGYTTFQLAAWKNHLKVLLKLWVWTEETQLNSKELSKKLFLAKINDEYIAWHLASLEGSIEALEILWRWAKEAELNTDELLLAQTGDGFTAFQMAAKKKSCRNTTENVGLAEKRQLNPKDLKKKLFLAKSNYGYIAWQRAAQFGSLEALWIWAKEVELNTHELLLSQSGDGYTAFQLAARKNHVKHY